MRDNQDLDGAVLSAWAAILDSLASERTDQAYPNCSFATQAGPLTEG
jgi:hypothetical protein